LQPACHSTPDTTVLPSSSFLDLILPQITSICDDKLETSFLSKAFSCHKSFCATQCSLELSLTLSSTSLPSSFHFLLLLPTVSFSLCRTIYFFLNGFCPLASLCFLEKNSFYPWNLFSTEHVKFILPQPDQEWLSLWNCPFPFSCQVSPWVSVGCSPAPSKDIVILH
jgi:hypothetical protein